MLLEFELSGSLVETASAPRPLYLLMNQLVAIHEPIPFITDPMGPGKARRCILTTRGGTQFEVADPVADVLDAMKFASRHIGVTPGIADKLDGETGEEIFPWRRAEKVTELARKWREHEKGKANAQIRPAGRIYPTPDVLPPLTREGVSARPSPPPSPTGSSGEAPSAGSATPEPTSESTSAPPSCPPKG